jgi:aminoglycoside phosphotransferase (APT) family kinase protein
MPKTGLEPPRVESAGRCSLWLFVERSGLRSLVVGASKDPNAKITILLISPGADVPVLAVKAPTTDLAAEALEAERRVLLDLQTLGPAPFLETVPRLVDTVDYDGRQAIVTTAVRGTPMTTSYMRRRHAASRARVAHHFEAAEHWLASFQRATCGVPRAVTMGAGVASRLVDRFGDELLEADLDRLAAIHARLRRETVPQTAVHGDFWFGNVLLADGRVTGVVDWEMGAASGEPARDLARFALMYALYLGGPARPSRRVPGHPGIRVGAWGAAVEYALNGSGWFPEQFRRFLGEGLSRLGATPAAWRDVALAGIAETAAFTDHGEFARLHLELFRRVAHTNGGRKETR